MPVARGAESEGGIFSAPAAGRPSIRVAYWGSQPRPRTAPIMPQSPPELAVIAAAYQLALWGSERIARFPRSHRFTLGHRLEGQLARLLDTLLKAKYTRDRAPLLRAANLELEGLRFQLRMAKDLKCLSRDSYGFAARSVNEVGRMVGGWLKHGAGPASSAVAPPGGGT